MTSPIPTTNTDPACGSRTVGAAGADARVEAGGNRWAIWLQRNDAQRYQLGRKAGWDAYVSAGPREPLDRLACAEFDALDEVERADYTEARMVWNANLPTIRTQQMSAAYQIIDQVMASNRRDGDRLRGSVVIDAAPGLGKTTIATRYAKDFHRTQYARYGPLTDEGHQRLPVAFVSLGSNMALKALNRTILEFYGHPAAQSATAARLAALTVDCVISCQTRLIDDLHFVDVRHRAGAEVSKSPQVAQQRDTGDLHLHRRPAGRAEVLRRRPTRRTRHLRPDRPPRHPTPGRTVSDQHPPAPAPGSTSCAPSSAPAAR